MHRFVLADGAVAPLYAIRALATINAERTAAWIQIIFASVDAVGEPRAAHCLADLSVINTPSVGGILTKVDFRAHCDLGHFQARATASDTSLNRATSCTEPQVDDRVIAAGFTTVSALMNDANGVGAARA